MKKNKYNIYLKNIKLQKIMNLKNQNKWIQKKLNIENIL